MTRGDSIQGKSTQIFCESCTVYTIYHHPITQLYLGTMAVMKYGENIRHRDTLTFFTCSAFSTSPLRINARRRLTSIPMVGLSLCLRLSNLVSSSPTLSWLWGHRSSSHFRLFHLFISSLMVNSHSLPFQPLRQGGEISMCVILLRQSAKVL